MPRWSNRLLDSMLTLYIYKYKITGPSVNMYKYNIYDKKMYPEKKIK